MEILIGLGIIAGLALVIASFVSTMNWIDYHYDWNHPLDWDHEDRARALFAIPFLLALLAILLVMAWGVGWVVTDIW